MAICFRRRRCVTGAHSVHSAAKYPRFHQKEKIWLFADEDPGLFHPHQTRIESIVISAPRKCG